MREHFGADKGEFRALSLQVKQGRRAQFSLKVINLNGPPKFYLFTSEEIGDHHLRINNLESFLETVLGGFRSLWHLALLNTSFLVQQIH